jgi:CelD/BcsL family acetyltransferase involved in cellulose biosynthesis
MQFFDTFNSKLQSDWENAFSKEDKKYPFYHFDWHRAWRETLGIFDRLVIGVSGNGHILPFRICDNTLSFTGGEEVADYLDLVGPDEKKPKALSDFFQLTAGRFNRILLRNIPHDSATINFFRDNLVWKNKVKITFEDTTPIIGLPNSREKYLESLGRKYRHELKRKIRRFQEQYPTVEFTADPAIGLTVERIFELMEFNPDKKKFLDRHNREFFQAILKLSYAKTFRLVDRKKTIAFKIYFPGQNQFLLYNSGYDPSYEGAGFMLTAQAIFYAIEKGTNYFNFLQGNERYKYDFGAKDFPVMRVETVSTRQ